MKRRKPCFRVRLRTEVVWELLNRLNMSQNELARRVGIRSSYMSQLMSGQRFASPGVRQRLMDVLGVNEFDDLFILEKNDEEKVLERVDE